MRLLVSCKTALRGSWWGKILAVHDTEPTELAGGLMKLVIGSQLLLPLETFSTSVAFRDLSILPEWLWGSLLAIIGILHLAALRDGYRPWRRVASAVGCVLWFALGTTFLHATPGSLGAWVFILAALGQAWCYVRLGSRV